MTQSANLFLPPLGDWSALATLHNEDGTPVNLTGFTASIVDVTGVLAGAMSVAIVDAALGVIRLTVLWQGAWPVTPELLGTFRLSLVNGGAENVSNPTAVWVQGTAETIPVQRGGDRVISFTWPDDRDGASLTGEALDVVGASGTLAPLVSVVVVDAATRACEIRIEGDLAVPLGMAGTFQLRRRIAGASPRTLPPIAVTYQ